VTERVETWTGADWQAVPPGGKKRATEDQGNNINLETTRHSPACGQRCPTEA